jgi:hypothetical protein
MRILIASMAPELFTVVDNRSAISLTMSDVLAQLQGDITPETWDAVNGTISTTPVRILAVNANRKSCIIQAKNTNSGKIYIGFDNSVATTKWVAELQAGMSFSIDDYRGDIYVISDTAAQSLGYGEW